MKFMISVALLLSLNICANAYFLSPEIWDPKPATVSICWNEATGNTPTYIDCGESQNIKIVSAFHLPSLSEQTCPNQYIAPVGAGILPINPCLIPINNNITANLIAKCHGQTSCAFKFNSILPGDGLRCLNVLTNTIRAPIPLSFTNIRLKYFCDGPRKRFRPFSNKRYDPKFSPELFHTARHPSNNRFVG